MEHSRAATATVGVTAAMVGFASSFAVVLAGLRGVGAGPDEASSGLVVLCVVMGVGTVALSRRHRIPVLLAWSTPGAALLASSGAVAGGWPAALGAFAAVAGLLVLTALWPQLGALVGRIPTPLAQAMLAGVLLPLCLAPVKGFADHPALVAPAVLTWLVALVVLRRWAVPLAFLVALLTVAAYVVRHGTPLGDLRPGVVWTTPQLEPAALLGIALPLYLVTMASQNLPGVAVLRSYDHPVPWRSTLAYTGLGTAAAAPFGGHAINLAAITAALTAGPEAHPDAGHRWRAADAAGWTYVALGAAAPALVALVTAAPAGIVEAVAGLALLATFGAATAAALGGDGPREPAVVTLVVAASGTTVLGIGAAFWSLLAGLAVQGLLRAGSLSR